MMPVLPRRPARRPRAPVRGRCARSGALSVALGLTVLLAGLALVPASPAHPRAAGPAGYSAPRLLPVGGGSFPTVTAPRPLASHEFYTQIGATLSEINNSYAIPGVPVLSEVIPLVVSPYPIGYELNLLTDTGDWYQVLVADNWPGCSSGFEEVLEPWYASGSGLSPTCDPTVSLAKGNLVELNGSLPSRATVCLGLTDLTTHRSHVVCQNQLDSGATEFLFLGSTANSNGYYTGTMTEIVNLSASSCPDYRLIPTVTFDFPSWADITEYVAWSDEWDYLHTGSTCYSHSTSGNYLPGSSPESHYADATGGSAYGPQEVEGQNDTPLNASVGFRFQSDPVPITSETLNTTGTNFLPGGGVALTSNTTGGIGPYRTLWEFDGGFSSGHSGSAWNFSTTIPGNYTFVAFGVDAQGDALGSPVLTIQVPFPLRVGALTASTGIGADAGETVNFSSQVSGGLAPLTYAWSGLPAGCASANRSWVACTPDRAQNVSIVLAVSDSNSSRGQTPALAFVVAPALSVVLEANRTVADLGQTIGYRAIPTGGSGGLAIAWSGLPTGCLAGVTQTNCTLSETGQFVVTVSVTDANRVTVVAAGVALAVSPPLSGAIHLSPSLIDLGLPVTLTGSITGGAGGDRYTWSGLPTGCPPTDAPTLACTPTHASTYAIDLTVTDRANASWQSTPVTLEVDPALSVSLEANRSNPTAPADLAIAPSVVGGSHITNVTWTAIPIGCQASGLAPVTCPALSAGAYTFTLEVTDLGQGRATATLQVLVGAALPTQSVPSTGGARIASWELGIAGIGVVVVGLAAGLVWRRRRRAPPPS